uniref:Palmitoyltransferase n=2 Tax=Ascaris TaxID=6251 RepID=A0A0M3IJR9_ASCLU
MGGCVDSPCVRFFICVFRWLPVCLIVAVVIWAYYAYVIQLCFYTVERVAERVLYLLIFHILLFLFLWSYYQTVFSEIGQPQKTFYLTSEVRRDLESAADDAECRLILDRFLRQHQVPVANRAFDGSVRYCHKCNCVKPDRSHHCSVCGKCVLKFDHHCPWVNTCVNYCNYKFFVLFLGYGLALCLFGFFTDMQYFIAFWKNELKQSEGFGRFHILFLFFVSGMFAVSLSCLFFYHLYLTSRNQSTIESFRPPMFAYGPDKNAYNLGVRRNFQQVFGRSRTLWFLPIFSSDGNGITFPQRGLQRERYKLLEESEDSEDEQLPVV